MWHLAQRVAVYFGSWQILGIDAKAQVARRRGNDNAFSRGRSRNRRPLPLSLSFSLSLIVERPNAKFRLHAVDHENCTSANKVEETMGMGDKRDFAAITSCLAKGKEICLNRIHEIRT